MKKVKKLFIAMFSTAFFGLSTAVILSNAKPLFAKATEACVHSGNHYAKLEPTQTEAGHSEFWACCKCHETFLEKPTTGTFADATDDQMTGGIDVKHPAYLDSLEEKVPQYKIVQGLTPSQKYLHLFYGKLEEGNEANVLPSDAKSNTDWPYYNVPFLKIVIEPSMYRYKGFTSTSGMFHNAAWVDEAEGFEYLNTENVTNMSNMFNSCFRRTNNNLTVDLSCLDTSKVTNFDSMFACSFQNGTGSVYFDTSKFNMSSAEKVTSMFASKMIKYVDISTLDFERITTGSNGSYMFSDASNLKAIFTNSNAAFTPTISSVFSSCSSSLHGYYLNGGSAVIGTTWDSSAISSSMATVCTGENQGGYFTDVSLKSLVMAL